MKRFFVAVVSCFMVGLFLTACATVTPDKKGAYTKKGMPRPAQEEVVPKDAAPQEK